MYEKYIKHALPYYNPDGELKEYRFTRRQLLALIDECVKNKERILGIVVLLEPSEKKYGEPCGFFNTDDFNTKSVEEIATLAKNYILAIKESTDTIYYSLELASDILLPKNTS